MTIRRAIAPADPEQPSSLLYRRVDLSGAVEVAGEAARQAYGTDARLELWSGNRCSWTTATTAFAEPLEGVHDLTVTLYGDYRLAALRFTP